MAGRELGAGAWSYFGDPRAISHDGHTFTGWVSTAGHIWVARLTKGGKLSKHLLFRGIGRDDHNNPSLVFLPRRAAGGVLLAALRARPAAARDPGADALPDLPAPVLDRRLGPDPHRSPTCPAGSGYTYPNPIQQRDRLWLFWRGARWIPTFSYTDDGSNGSSRASS